MWKIYVMPSPVNRNILYQTIYQLCLLPCLAAAAIFSWRCRGYLQTLYSLSPKLISVQCLKIQPKSTRWPHTCHSYCLSVFKEVFSSSTFGTHKAHTLSISPSPLESWAKSVILLSFEGIKVFLNRLLACRWMSQEGEAHQSSKHWKCKKKKNGSKKVGWGFKEIGLKIRRGEQIFSI